MRTVLELFRIAFISFESVFLLLVAAVATFFPNWLIVIGEALRSDPTIVAWIPVIPIALCGVVSQMAWKLTTPLEASSRELMDWPGYWQLKMRRDYSIILSVLAVAVAAGVWVFAKRLDWYWTGLLTIAALGLAIINVGCMSFAAFTLREIMEK